MRKLLQAELNMDLHRLWLRNLGRDDRAVSDCSREVRYPFLDDWLVGLVHRLPLELLCDLNGDDQGKGKGLQDKVLARRVARSLGLLRASTLQKRAMQFGTRIADRKGKLFDTRFPCLPFLHRLSSFCLFFSFSCNVLAPADSSWPNGTSKPSRMRKPRRRENRDEREIGPVKVNEQNEQ